MRSKFDHIYPYIRPATLNELTPTDEAKREELIKHGYPNAHKLNSLELYRAINEIE
jgi:hypothetical protein